MARTKNFDRQDKLIEAMHLFWEKGYAETSVSDLVERLGINRFSLYSTYGDKHTLYHETLEYYLNTYSCPRLDAFFGEDSGLESIFDYLSRFCALQKEQREGCFMQNALLEKCLTDEFVLAAGNRLFDFIIKTMTHALENAKLFGQIKPDVNIPQTASFILLQMQGFRVLGKCERYEDVEAAKNVAFEYLDSLKS
ncbi:TetR/AcrR family transcriptional regulator [Parasalinivibrio latis]|uniref:TetR/AcrR family transcriptional regulator n=1 Tax=Parasalinivibrio latis TaxID=2952610 RepID=UPI0030E4B0AE